MATGGTCRVSGVRQRLAGLWIATGLAAGALGIAGSLDEARAAEPEAVGVFGAWSVQCATAAGWERPHCTATQLVATDPAGKKAVLGVTLDRVDTQPKPRIAFRLTAAAYRPAGVAIKIDDFKPMRLPLTNCDDRLCETQAWLDDDVVARMRKGKVLQFAYFLDPKNQATYPVSLMGFTEALAALDKRR